jgi:hypothetical protein
LEQLKRVLVLQAFLVVLFLHLLFRKVAALGDKIGKLERRRYWESWPSSKGCRVRCPYWWWSRKHDARQILSVVKCIVPVLNWVMKLIRFRSRSWLVYACTDAAQVWITEMLSHERRRQSLFCLASIYKYVLACYELLDGFVVSLIGQASKMMPTSDSAENGKALKLRVADPKGHRLRCLYWWWSRVMLTKYSVLSSVFCRFCAG